MMMRDRKSVAARIGVSTQTLDRMVVSMEFPSPLRIHNRLRWPIEVVDHWLDEQLQSCLDKKDAARKTGSCG